MVSRCLWVNSELHGARPAAGIPWLVSRFKQYVVMRERLLTDTQGLRSRLGSAVQGAAPAATDRGAPVQGHGSACGAGLLRALIGTHFSMYVVPSFRHPEGGQLQRYENACACAKPGSSKSSDSVFWAQLSAYVGPFLLRIKCSSSQQSVAFRHAERDSDARPPPAERMNANTPAKGPPGGAASASARLAAALQYKRARAPSAGSGKPSAAGSAAAAPATSPAGAASAAPAGGGQTSGYLGNKGSAAGAARDLAAKLPPGAPARVRSAMEAATEYRRRRAEAVSAAARAAAAAAAGRSDAGA